MDNMLSVVVCVSKVSKYLSRWCKSFIISKDMVVFFGVGACFEKTAKQNT